MTEDLKCCIFYSFLKFTGLCVNTPGSWLLITIDIVGGAFESKGQPAGVLNLMGSCLAMLDPNCGVHLWVIWPSCTQLLTLLANSEVTLLSARMSYSLQWKLFWADPT